MVAMGSSLADRAWGRESAVYRITGVISVIGGWFITAGAAFIMAFIIASLNNFGGGIAMVLIIGIVAFTLINNNRRFKKKQQQAENVDTVFRELVHTKDKQEAWTLLKKHVADTQVTITQFTQKSLMDILEGLENDDVKKLYQVQAELTEQKAMWKRYRRKEVLGMRKIDYLQAVEKNTWFHLGCNCLSQCLYSLKRILEPCVEHVDNNFNPIQAHAIKELKPIVESVSVFLTHTEEMIKTNEFSKYDELLVEGNALKARISQIRHGQQDRIQREDSNIKTDLLYLNILQEIQEIVSQGRHLLRASNRFQS
jgi:hypothetical protein